MSNSTNGVLYYYLNESDYNNLVAELDDLDNEWARALKADFAYTSTLPRWSGYHFATGVSLDEDEQEWLEENGFDLEFGFFTLSTQPSSLAL